MSCSRSAHSVRSCKRRPSLLRIANCGDPSGHSAFRLQSREWQRRTEHRASHPQHRGGHSTDLMLGITHLFKPNVTDHLRPDRRPKGARPGDRCGRLVRRSAVSLQCMGRSIVGEECMRKYAAILRWMSGSTSRLKPGRIVQKVADEAGQPGRQGRQQRTVAPLGISASRSHAAQD